MLKQKGIYPYEWMNEWKRMESTELPPVEEFYSSLRDAGCSDEDYELAEKVWESFDCETMKDYTEHYLKCMSYQLLLIVSRRFLYF